MEKRNTDEYISRINKINELIDPVTYANFNLEFKKANITKSFFYQGFLERYFWCIQMYQSAKTFTDESFTRLTNDNYLNKYIDVELLKKNVLLPLIKVKNIEDDIWKSAYNSPESVEKIRNYFKEYIYSEININKMAYLSLQEFNNSLKNNYSPIVDMIRMSIKDGYLGNEDEKIIVSCLREIIYMLRVEKIELLKLLNDNRYKDEFIHIEEQKIIELSDNTLENKDLSFESLFVSSDYNKYLDLIINSDFKLLEKTENGKYKYIGNQRTQKGVIAAYFKTLKARGIINQSANRVQIAKVLSTQIENYSISGSSIDNKSGFYEDKFYPNIEYRLKQLASVSKPIND